MAAKIDRGVGAESRITNLKSGRDSLKVGGASDRTFVKIRASERSDGNRCSLQTFGLSPRRNHDVLQSRFACISLRIGSRWCRGRHRHCWGAWRNLYDTGPVQSRLGIRAADQNRTTRRAFGEQAAAAQQQRSEEHTSELQSLMS